MTLRSRFRSWFRAIVQRSRMESEMDVELRFHMEAYTEDLIRTGVPRTEAMRRARVECDEACFGGHCNRHSCGPRSDTVYDQVAIRRWSYRCRDVCRSSGGAGAHRLGRRLRTGKSGDANRSPSSPALRVVRTGFLCPRLLLIAILAGV